jgi:hypothetical protein
MNDIAQMPLVGWILIFTIVWLAWEALKRLYRGSYFYRGERKDR